MHANLARTPFDPHFLELPELNEGEIEHAAVARIEGVEFDAVVEDAHPIEVPHHGAHLGRGNPPGAKNRDAGYALEQVA